nr:immunoglobulin heavy chain junction region [Macaca mulatta]
CTTTFYCSSIYCYVERDYW